MVARWSSGSAGDEDGSKRANQRCMMCICVMYAVVNADSVTSCTPVSSRFNHDHRLSSRRYVRWSDPTKPTFEGRVRHSSSSSAAGSGYRDSMHLPCSAGAEQPSSLQPVMHRWMLYEALSMSVYTWTSMDDPGNPARFCKSSGSNVFGLRLTGRSDKHQGQMLCLSSRRRPVRPRGRPKRPSCSDSAASSAAEA
jgi:hypothetical protein